MQSGPRRYGHDGRAGLRRPTCRGWRTELRHPEPQRSDGRGIRRWLDAEVIERKRADAATRDLLTRRVAKAETARRKPLDAYYGGAIEFPTLKIGQARIDTDLTVAQDRLADPDANLSGWQEILEPAAFVTRCGDAYRKAGDRTRRQFNAAVFTRLGVKIRKYRATLRGPGHFASRPGYPILVGLVL